MIEHHNQHDADGNVETVQNVDGCQVHTQEEEYTLHYLLSSALRNPLHHVRHLQASSILIALVTLYQKTLSPDHGPLRHLYNYGYCRHAPTCSEYAKIQLAEKGVIVGSFLAIKRVLSCNPFTKISDAKWREMAKREL